MWKTNALKHGILCAPATLTDEPPGRIVGEEAVVRGAWFGESREEFGHCMSGLWRTYSRKGRWRNCWWTRW